MRKVLIVFAVLLLGSALVLSAFAISHHMELASAQERSDRSLAKLQALTAKNPKGAITPEFQEAQSWLEESLEDERNAKGYRALGAGLAVLSLGGSIACFVLFRRGKRKAEAAAVVAPAA